MTRSRARTWPTWAALAAGALAAGCRSFGPHALEQTRLPYNEAVKVTTEQQLLLNIVRLRYTDTPSSLSISNIAAQFEITKGLQIVPFFTATGGDYGTKCDSCTFLPRP